MMWQYQDFNEKHGYDEYLSAAINDFFDPATDTGDKL